MYYGLGFQHTLKGQDFSILFKVGQKFNIRQVTVRSEITGLQEITLLRGIVNQVHTIAGRLDSLLLRRVAPRPCFWQRARRHKHARHFARSRDGLKPGLVLRGLTKPLFYVITMEKTKTTQYTTFKTDITKVVFIFLDLQLFY